MSHNVGELSFDIALDMSGLHSQLTRAGRTISQQLSTSITSGTRQGMAGANTAVNRGGHQMAQTMQGHTGRMRAGLGSLAGAAAGMFAAVKIKDFAMDSIKQASELQQSAGGLDAVFKELSPSMKAWSEQQYAIGLSTTAASKSVTQMGSMLKGAGLSLDDAAAKSKSLVQTGADLAATYGGTTTDAVAALGSALKGEYDPLESFGVSIKESTVQAKALDMGLAKTTSTLTQTDKATAAYALIVERSADAHGMAAREAGTYQSQLERAGAQFKNLKAEAGKALLPIATKYMTALNASFPSLQKKIEEVAPKIDAAIRHMFDALKQEWPTIKATLITVGHTLQTLQPIISGVANVFAKLPEPLRQAILISGVAAFAFRRLLLPLGMLGTVGRGIPGVFRGVSSAIQRAGASAFVTSGKFAVMAKSAGLMYLAVTGAMAVMDSAKMAQNARTYGDGGVSDSAVMGGAGLIDHWTGGKTGMMNPFNKANAAAKTLADTSAHNDAVRRKHEQMKAAGTLGKAHRPNRNELSAMQLSMLGGKVPKNTTFHLKAVGAESTVMAFRKVGATLTHALGDAPARAVKSKQDQIVRSMRASGEAAGKAYRDGFEAQIGTIKLPGAAAASGQVAAGTGATVVGTVNIHTTADPNAVINQATRQARQRSLMGR